MTGSANEILELDISEGKEDKEKLSDIHLLMKNHTNVYKFAHPHGQPLFYVAEEAPHRSRFVIY